MVHTLVRDTQWGLILVTFSLNTNSIPTLAPLMAHHWAQDQWLFSLEDCAPLHLRAICIDLTIALLGNPCTQWEMVTLDPCTTPSLLMALHPLLMVLGQVQTSRGLDNQ